MRYLIVIIMLVFSTLSLAEDALVENLLVEDAPVVGKHVMSNMDAGSMIVSLLMVLALIVVSAFVLKRFNIVQQGNSQLKVISSLSLGAKERIVVIQTGDKQLLLGVTAQQITLLDTLSEPLEVQSTSPLESTTTLLSLLKGGVKRK